MESSPPRYDWSASHLNHGHFTLPRSNNHQIRSTSPDISADPVADFSDQFSAPYASSSSSARHLDTTGYQQTQEISRSGVDASRSLGGETWGEFLRDDDLSLNDDTTSTTPGNRRRAQEVTRRQQSAPFAYPRPAQELHAPSDPSFFRPTNSANVLYATEGSLNRLASPLNHHRDSSRSNEHPVNKSITTLDPLAAKRAAIHEENRKRRLTGPAQGGREEGSSGVEAGASRPRMSQPGIIDLTSSPPNPRRDSYGRRPSGMTASLERRRSSVNAGAGGSMRLDGLAHEHPLQPSDTTWIPPAAIPTEGGRRQSDVVLPRWQLDSEVSRCPVCNSQFGFFYRKHHCRRCGRVVCANCSPHRITMPHQYIVQPDLIDLTYEDGDASPQHINRQENIGGGSQVRVCNPCVPDPNLSPPPRPPSYEAANFLPHPSNRSLPHGMTIPDMGRLQHYSGMRRASQFNAQEWMQNNEEQQGLRSARPSSNHSTGADPFSDGRVTFSNPTSTSDLFPPFALQSQRHPSILDAPLPPPPGPRPPRQAFTAFVGDQLTAPRSSSRIHRAHHSTGNAGLPPPPDPRRFSTYVGHSLPHTSGSPSPFQGPPDNLRIAPRPPLGPDAQGTPPPPPPPPPRRQIPEEDECPVCGNEFPPRGPNNEDADRERHVEQCIASHFAPSGPSRANSTTTTARPTADPMQPDPTLPQNFPTGASSSAPTFLPPANPLSRSRTGSSSIVTTDVPRQRRATGTRMLAYIATEKDCVGDDGEAAECIICFEEFEPGVELGRLECLCKFHRGCIRQWWDTKGVGSCPTHQLHD